ncbi:sugar ABC transporter permease [Catenulispora yoronensis]|uniref:Sugar ABC transporter permease n=1 Tax=Catenulispora yoronensis TaxID=450799 RepID=A0ABN2VC81_9ACTN
MTTHAERGRSSRPRPHGARSALSGLAPLAWIGPAIVLIAFAVLWPVVKMVQSSTRHWSRYGVDLGSNGTDNYSKLFKEQDLGGVLLRTGIWVVVVVSVTMLVSLGVAQLFNQRFPGRTVARWALIAPWAASVMMTAIIFKWMLYQGYGFINILLDDLGLVDRSSPTADWLGHSTSGFVWAMGVAVFVSIPFTSYTVIAGLQTVPAEVYEAAKMDGASKLRTYWSVTLPMLRPSLLVATVINVMNVFNSFPIIWEMTRGGPGYDTSTTTVFMWILKRQNIGESAALSVVNFLLVIVIVLAFLKVSKWNSEAD